MPRILHVVETLGPREGGPPRVVASLAVAQRSLGIEAEILCGDGDSLPEYLSHWQSHISGFPTESVHTPGHRRGASFLGRAAGVWRWLRMHLADYDVIHMHQLWRLMPTLVGISSRRGRIPYLIAPHTSLSSWALAQKGAKKSAARLLVWNRILIGASAFHALNELEASEVRGCLGVSCPPVFVVPNGVTQSELIVPANFVPPASVAGLSCPEGGTPFILFLARLHTMKGPDLLLEAFARLAARYPHLRLVFAGPDFGMLEQLQRRAAQLCLGERVFFLGLVSGDLRPWLLRNAVCLCQPSRDEGFSLSILEALACARPVVISDRCKFPEVGASGAGCIVPASTSEIAVALDLYIANRVRRECDGTNASRLINQRFTWSIIAGQTAEMYSKIVRTGQLTRGQDRSR